MAAEFLTGSNEYLAVVGSYEAEAQESGKESPKIKLGHKLLIPPNSKTIHATTGRVVSWVLLSFPTTLPLIKLPPPAHPLLVACPEC